MFVKVNPRNWTLNLQEKSIFRGYFRVYWECDALGERTWIICYDYYRYYFYLTWGWCHYGSRLSHTNTFTYSNHAVDQKHFYIWHNLYCKFICEFFLRSLVFSFSLYVKRIYRIHYVLFCSMWMSHIDCVTNSIQFNRKM